MREWDGAAFDRWLTTEPEYNPEGMTRDALAELIRETGQTGHLIARTAAKPHRCTCADAMLPNGSMEPRRNPNYRPDCLAEIAAGDAYAEYTGEAEFAQSGSPYCIRCAYYAWLGD